MNYGSMSFESPRLESLAVPIISYFFDIVLQFLAYHSHFWAP